MSETQAKPTLKTSRARQLLPSAFFALGGILALFLAWVRYDFASSFAQDAGITLWTALTDAKAVAGSVNVEAGVKALQKLTEATITAFTAAMFFVSAILSAIPVLRRTSSAQVPRKPILREQHQARQP